jgi:hypothetical protein
MPYLALDRGATAGSIPERSYTIAGYGLPETPPLGSSNHPAARMRGMHDNGSR